jgi:hypothetical protein
VSWCGRDRKIGEHPGFREEKVRYDAEQTVAAFAAWQKDAVDLDSVRNDPAGTVHRSLEPAHVSVWVSRGD